MQRLVLPAIFTAITLNTASAGPLNLNAPDTPGARPFAQPYPQAPLEAPPVRQVQGPSFGGGFLEMLFRGPGASRYEPNPLVMPQQEPRGYRQPYDPADDSMARPAVSPRFMKQVVSYDGKEKAGTIIINTNERLLYLVQDDGKAIRYGIGVGRPGFTWAGVHQVSRKREW